MAKRLQKGAIRGVRLADVANSAGCSTATVSRVLNDPERVNPEVRDRVLAAMRELGYMPNSAARALRSQRSHIMGIVIPTLHHAIYARLVEGMQRKLAERWYSLLVATFEYDLRREREQAHLLIERGVEGLAMVGELHEPELYEDMQRLRLPYVNTYVYRPDALHPCVGFDNCQVMEQVVDYLTGLGHRRFGMISGITANNDRAAQRLLGVRKALEKHGLKLSKELVYERPFAIASGREGLRYLRSLNPPPTAIVCGNDILAMGAVIECGALKLKIPRQVSIVGFDNLEFASFLDPPLTTMEVPASYMGERAAELLLHRVLGESTVPSVQIDPRLVVRRSTGPMKEQK